METILIFSVGVFVGLGFAVIFVNRKKYGVLKIVKIDDEPQLFLELTTSLKRLVKSNFVLLIVDKKIYNTQKKHGL